MYDKFTIYVLYIIIQNYVIVVPCNTQKGRWERKTWNSCNDY